MHIPYTFEGDCLDVLATLSERSVQTCITSPPYYGLRDYGTGTWTGGDSECDHKRRVIKQDGLANVPCARGAGGTMVPAGGQKARESQAEVSYGAECGKCGATRTDSQIGLEETPEQYVANLVAVFREVRRVLRGDGTVWLNLGDSYAGAGYANRDLERHNGPDASSGGKPRHGSVALAGIKSKDLLGIPWMVAFALRADGWYLRSDIIWAKPNPMPESVTDRPTKAHEYLFLLSKSRSYFYDSDSIREGVSPDTHGGTWTEGGAKQTILGQQIGGRLGNSPDSGLRNRRSVWTVATQPFPGAHFACVDADTEALTPDGWRSHDELENGDQIAAYDQATGRLRWEPATVHRYPFTGELVSIEKRDLSLRLTPDHRCLVRSVKGVERVVKAGALTPGVSLPVAADFDMPSGGYMDARWGALLGWWITEGHDRGGNAGRIYQSESANAQHVATIRECLQGVDADFSESRRERTWRGRPSVEIEFRIRGDVLTQLRLLAPERRLTPTTLANASDHASRQALLDALIDGDGHRRADGRACIVQRDRATVDAMQALAVTLGYRGHITQRSDGVHMLYLTRKRWITLRGSNGRHEPIGREYYDGTVWCPNVPSSFWLARRNGKPFITGNTFPPKLIEPCVLAGSSPQACAECGAPWERVTETTKPPLRETRTAGPVGSHGLLGGNRRDEPIQVRTTGWQPTCDHSDGSARCTVLDPFSGAGTTGVVALRHDRDFIGIELNPSYAQMARYRIGDDAPLLNTEAA